ncbi:mediator of RNA polymerase II transcription subunit 15 [Anopheles merus]|uniref:mediator of RNA polymerase II transcription subunit 15 n=1 Tax=Anopheles merus TaxID=30066 RepID=UPI001BE4C98A|nr:mediator of RNA polymerase II transcription subunit 15 [Anopheles merus]
MAEDNSWKTSNFRQSVVNKINEAIQQTGMTSSKNGIEMENHVFHKARNKDEYLGFVARLILHVREMNTKHKNQQNAAAAAAAAAQQAQQDGGGNSSQQGGGGGGGGSGMPDPINALQNLASQGTRPQMMGQMGVGPGGPMGGQMGGAGQASNLLHSLRPQMQMGGMGGPMQGNRVGMGPGNQMGGMMGGPNQMQGPGAGMVGGMPGQMGVGMGPGGMSGGKIVGMGGQQQQMAQLNAMQVNQMQQAQQQQQQQQGGMSQPQQQQQQQQQQQGGIAQGQGGPVQQMGVGPGGPNQMNPMVMGQIQAQLQNQNAMGGQQMGTVGGTMNAGNQMGQMVGANAGMNPQAMGMASNQVVRQQQLQQQGMGQVQMGLGPGQMGQLSAGVQGGVGHGGPAMQQQQQSGGMGPGAGPNQMNPGVAMGPGGVVGPAGGGGVMGPGPNQMLGAGGAGGPGAGQQGNFVGMGANAMVRKPPEMMPGGNVYPGSGGAVRSVTPNNFLRQSPSPSVPSPVGPGAHGPPSHPGQMIPSPALIPSPNPHMGGVAQRSTIGQSPGGSLNTPGQPGGAVPSPLNPQDEQLYREKYRALTKYIEPLKRMIAKMENDDIDKIAKMKRLLEILSNPSVRIPLETLHKCEAALTSQLGSIRETPTNNPLVEAVSSSLQAATGNHTLQRTFRPCLEALFGPDIKNLPPPAKQSRLALDDTGAAGGTGGGVTTGGATTTTTSTTTAAATTGSASSTTSTTASSTTAPQEIPHILQGEIARLDQKFKVSLDQCAISGTRTIKLICWLDDKNLPCVPPVAVTIPEDYPSTAPSCSLIEQEYNATPFLILVQKSLMARICKLPGLFTLSHLLDTWEMSVRQACSPNPTIVAPTGTSVLLGM